MMKRNIIKYILSILLGICIGIAIQPWVENFVNYHFYKPQVNVIVLSAINLYSDEPFEMIGETVQLFDSELSYREGHNNTCIYDFAFKPFPSKNITFKQIVLEYNPFSLEKRDRNIHQSIFITNTGKGSVENFQLKICYGLPILNISGDVLYSVDNCVLIYRDKIFPTKNFTDRPIEFGRVELLKNSTILNTSDIIKNFEMKYYRKYGIFEGWVNLDRDYFLHWGSFVSDACPPSHLSDSLAEALLRAEKSP